MAVWNAIALDAHGRDRSFCVQGNEPYDVVILGRFG